jgi:signal transduction histidine kinase
VSFRVRLFLMMTMVTTLIVLVAMVVVNYRFQANLNKQVGNEFEFAHSRIDRFQKLGLENLVTLAVNISQDPRLRGSIVTGDRVTIGHALDETYLNYWPDLFWVLSPNGIVIARVDQPRVLGDTLTNRAVVEDAHNGFDSGDIWLFEGKLYQIAVVPIRSGEITVGLLLVGEQFDTHLTQSFTQLSGLDLAFLGETGLLSASQAASLRPMLDAALTSRSGELTSLQAPSVPSSPHKPDSSKAPFIHFQVANEPFAGAVFNLCDVSGHKLATGVVYRSLASDQAQLSRIQKALLFVGLAAILLTFAAAYYLSSRVTRPIQRLAASSSRLGRGDLESKISPEGGDEIGSLAIALEDMRVSLKQAHEDLIQGERLSTIGRMASSIIHDFRQPISAIYGYIDLMTMPQTKPEDADKYRDAVFKQFDRMLGMINELLDFARGDVKLNRMPVQLSGFLNEIKLGFERECLNKNIVIESRYDWDGYLSIDAARLQRGVENIIRNAVQVLKQGGRIDISTAQAGAMIVVKVRDCGPGIPPEIMEKIFEPFVTHGKSEGTGLGLAVAKKVIEQHGGDITIESAPGQGATFSISLPIHD